MIKIDFEQELDEQLNKLPYTKHLDDGQYNDGVLDGFELGARWCYERCLTDEKPIFFDFVNWIARNNWMSIWVKDKWMWEYQEEVSSGHPWVGYFTEEQLFKLYYESYKI